MITFKNGLKISLADTVATQALAGTLAQGLRPGLCIYLHGDLGAGKTTLVRAMLESLGVTGAIKSPTYTLVENYKIAGANLYHFDLYRLSDPSELEYIGIRDYVNGSAICIFEWPLKGLGYVPAADIEINLDFNGTGRVAQLTANTANGLAALQSITLGPT